MENIMFKENEFYNWLQTTDFAGPVGITAKFYLKNIDQVAKFRETMNKNIEITMNETGVRLYKLFADYKSPLIFYLTEEWDSAKVLFSEVNKFEQTHFLFNKPAPITVLLNGSCT